MALKTDFEETSVISSPFVDEIANTGHIVRAASPLQLARQGSKLKTIRERERQLREEKARKTQATQEATKKILTRGRAIDELRKKARGLINE